MIDGIRALKKSAQSPNQRQTLWYSGGKSDLDIEHVIGKFSFSRGTSDHVK